MVSAMREMKDSGIDWIGDIPTKWETNKIKYITRLRSEKKRLSNVGRYIGLENVESCTGKYVETETEYLDGIYDACEQDDLLYGKLRPNLAKAIIAPFSACCTGEFEVIYFSDIGKKYLQYYMLTDGFTQIVTASTYGAKMPRASWDFIKNLEVAYPSATERNRIVSFLDAKCAEIDALSADIQSEIDTLQAYKRSVITEAVTKGLDKNVPMKDSGLPWVGEMPSHWELVRGKYCLKYLQKPVREDDGVITCFRDGEVTLRSKRREEGFTMSDKEIGYQGIDEGDLVVHGMDGFAGAIGISDARGKASPVLNVLDTEENKKYFMYYLRSMAYGDVFLALATGIRVRSCDLRWNKLAELFYPIPERNEEDRIVDYIKEKQEQLEVLADYKKSIIYEYVTGKKEVPAV